MEINKITILLALAILLLAGVKNTWTLNQTVP